MDRLMWLAERRAAVVAAYDCEAPAYDEHEYPSDAQRTAKLRPTMSTSIPRTPSGSG